MFTDEDLKRLKEQVEEDPGVNHDVWMGRDKTEALLARLEAAEQVCVDVGYPDHPHFLDEIPWRREHYNAWRKAAGK